MKTKIPNPTRYWLALLLAASQAGLRLAAAETTEPHLGEVAPSFALKTVSGDNVSLKKPDKQWLVLQFVATWCPISNQKIGALEALYKKNGGPNLRFLAVDIGEDPAEVKKWVEQHFLTYPMLLDEKGGVAASYAPKDHKPDINPADLMVSSTLLIDPAGVIRYYDDTSDDTRLVILAARLKELIPGR